MICLFSSRLLPCLGTSAKETSIIYPDKSGKVIQILKNQDFKHQQSIKRWSADIVAILRFIEDNIKNRGKDFPIDMIIELGEFFKQKVVVKKLRHVGVDVFHENWSN